MNRTLTYSHVKRTFLFHLPYFLNSFSLWCGAKEVLGQKGKRWKGVSAQDRQEEGGWSYKAKYVLTLFPSKVCFNHIIKIAFVRLMSFLNYAGGGPHNLSLWIHSLSVISKQKKEQGWSSHNASFVLFRFILKKDFHSRIFSIWKAVYEKLQALRL